MVVAESAEIHAAASRLCKSLSAELAKAKAADHATVTRLRAHLRAQLLGLVVSDVVYAAAHDLSRMLWNHCFYAHIDAHRRRIRELEAARARQPAVKTSDALAGPRAKLGAVLDAAAGFYHGLLRRLVRRYGLQHTGLLNPLCLSLGAEHGCNPAALGAGADEVEEAALLACHGCLVFLGDLARYQETHRLATKASGVAAAYYVEALKLQPGLGMPQNQLAILATFREDYVAAAYRYVRAACAETPVPKAKENLKKLFRTVVALPRSSAAGAAAALIKAAPPRSTLGAASGARHVAARPR